MYSDRCALEEYPFDGEFYMYAAFESEDGSLLDEGAESDDGSLLDDDDDDDDNDSSSGSDTSDGTEEISILTVKCDIQDSSTVFSSSTITRGYRIYFPFDTEEGIPASLRPGVYFRGEMFGVSVGGVVMDPVATQMGCCIVEIKGTDI